MLHARWQLTEGAVCRREQLQLWGALALVVIIIAIVIVCWKKDTYLCEGKTLRQRCSACCCAR